MSHRSSANAGSIDVDEEDVVDLRSDTVTRPSAAMRTAAAEASVGDDVYGEDPTVTELEARAAGLVGMAAALFVPSGTMGNQIAARTYTDRGQEVVIDVEAHAYTLELAGLAQHAGLQPRPVDAGPRGVLTPDDVDRHVVTPTDHRPGTGLVWLENTHNRYGGTAVSPEAIGAAAEAAHDLGVPVHLDGARIANAAVAHGVPVHRYGDRVDTLMFCLSKGLGAPVGSILTGPEPFIRRARRVRKLFGGGLRQAGIIAAPGLLALENVDRLAEDHATAATLASGLDDLAGLRASDPETNIVVVDTSASGLTAAEFVTRCQRAGVLGNAIGEATVRLCTHLDVSPDEVAAAVDRVGAIVE